MDISILAGLQSAAAPLKAALEVANALMATKDEVKVQALMHSLYKEISSAQMGMLTAGDAAMRLQQRVQELETKLNTIEAWKVESSRYALIDFGDNTFARKLRPDVANGEPDHLLCAGCFDSGKKGLLQFTGTNFKGQREFICVNCKTVSSLGREQPAEDSYHVVTSGNWMTT